MKLRKTLAGILGAVVMLLGVGTFEHINREKGVHAATVWELVTDASTLESGDKIVIAESSKGFVASNTITSNYMTNVATTFSSDKSTITSLPSTAAILTLGGSSGSWTLTNGSGKKLGATDVKKVAWGSGTTTWSISIASNNATIQNGKSTYGRFLYNVNSPRFTTYTSNTSKSMLLPQIYRNVQVDEAVQLGEPQLTLNAYNGIVTWGQVDNAVKYQYSINEGAEVYTTETSIQLVDGQSIKVKAIGDGTNYLDSDYSEKVTYNAIDANADINTLISEFYNNGIYTKKSEIHISETAVEDLSELFHNDGKQPISQERTTYYNGDALLMGNLDGTISYTDGINSGYRNKGSYLQHYSLEGTLESWINNPEDEGVCKDDWVIEGTTLDNYFVTLKDFVQSYSGWKCTADNFYTFEPSGGSSILDKSSKYVQDFVAFVAPCLDPKLYENNNELKDFFQFTKLTISKENHEVYKDYLSLKIYLVDTAYSEENGEGLVDNEDRLLAESRIYKGLKVINENATARIEVNASENGTVSSNNEKEYYVLNEEITYTLIPNDGYEITAISYNGTNLDIANNLGCDVTIKIIKDSAINKLDVTFTKIPEVGQETYSYTFSAKQYSSNSSKTLGDVNWTLAGNGGYWGYDATKGQQLGSGKNPYKSLTLTSTEFKNVTKIIINTSGGSSVNATLYVYVGGVKIGSVKIEAGAKSYEFECDKITGEVQFSYTQTSSKAIYIKSISVTYSE